MGSFNVNFLHSQASEINLIRVGYSSLSVKDHWFLLLAQWGSSSAQQHAEEAGWKPLKPAGAFELTLNQVPALYITTFLSQNFLFLEENWIT